MAVGYEAERVVEDIGILSSSPGQAATAGPPQDTLQSPVSTSPNSPTSRSSAPINEDAERSSTQIPDKSYYKRLLEKLPRSRQDPNITFDYRVPNLIRAVDEYEQGYGRLAAFEDCDPSFLIYRRFGWLHSRLLLHLQDEIQELEEELERLDKWESQQGDPKKLRSNRKDILHGSKRQAQLVLIRQKLAEYDEWIFRLQKVHAIKSPSKRDQSSLYQEASKNLVSVEGQWIRQHDDLAALAHDSEHDWFNVWLETKLNRLSRNILLYCFRNKDQKIKTGQIPHLNLVSPKRFDGLLRSILTVLASLLLLVPTLLLFELQTQDPSRVKSRGRYQLGVVFGFTLVFSACYTIFTKARKQEVFTATAAYSAVLVVFLSNTSQVIITSNV